MLDGFAVVALVFAEPGGVEVRRILERVVRSEAFAAMTVVNWGEALYIVERRAGRARAQEVAAALDGVGVSIVPVDRGLASRAARLKVGGRVSYADCFAAALAQLRGAAVVTGDPEFRRIETDVEIEWLPQRPRM